MNDDLRQDLSRAFAAGTAEELAVILQLLYLISLHPKTREADPDFSRPDRLRFARCKQKTHRNIPAQFIAGNLPG
jgi:hypothetical protein